MTADTQFVRADSKPERRKALFRLLAFFAFSFVLMIASGVVQMILLGMKEVRHFSLATTAGTALAVLLAMVATALIAKDKPAAFGFGRRRAARNFLIGLVCGPAFLAAQLGILAALGGFSFGTLSPPGDALLHSAFVLAGTFLLVGFAEESLWRGYVLVQLARTISFWPAAAILSAIFAAGHAANGGENLIGLSSAFLFGIVLAASFRLTGSLWFAVGTHAAWDYGQSFVFGVPDSGLRIEGALFHPSIHGPAWLTGGSAGPEGSVLTAFSLLAILAASWLLRVRAAASS